MRELRVDLLLEFLFAYGGSEKPCQYVYKHMN